MTIENENTSREDELKDVLDVKDFLNKLKSYCDTKTPGSVIFKVENGQVVEAIFSS